MSNFDKSYDIDYLSKVIQYNCDRYKAFKEGVFFETIPEYEKVLNARYCKVGRIKRRLIYLLSRYDYIWFCTFTFER